MVGVMVGVLDSVGVYSGVEVAVAVTRMIHGVSVGLGVIVGMDV